MQHPLCNAVITNWLRLHKGVMQVGKNEMEFKLAVTDVNDVKLDVSEKCVRVNRGKQKSVDHDWPCKVQTLITDIVLNPKVKLSLSRGPSLSPARDADAGDDT